jgi:hypothetical protein
VVEALVKRNSSMIAHRLNDVSYEGTDTPQGIHALIFINVAHS